MARTVNWIYLAVLVYIPALWAGLRLDDWRTIWHSRILHWGWRKIPMATLWAQHELAGLDPMPYLAVNILLHLAASVALFYLLKRSYGYTWPALLFAVHPLCTGAVTYISQRMEILYAIYSIFAIIGWLEFRRNNTTKNLLACGLCLLAAIMCKEKAIIITIVIAAYEITHYRITAKRVLGVICTILAVLIAAVLKSGITWEAWTVGMYGQPYTGIERLIAQGQVQIGYITQVFLPVYQGFDVHIQHEIDLFSLIALAAIVCTIMACVALAWRRPVIFFPLLAYWLTHAVEILHPGLELRFEHHMYLPLACLAWWLSKYRLGWQSIAILALILGSLTTKRNLEMADPVAMCRNEWHSNKSYRAAVNCASEMMVQGYRVEAESYWIKAISAREYNGEAWYGLGSLYLLLGDRESLQCFEKALEINPKDPRYLTAMIRELNRRGLESTYYNETLVRVMPDHPYVTELQRQDRVRRDRAMNRAEGLPTSAKRKDGTGSP